MENLETIRSAKFFEQEQADFGYEMKRELIKGYKDIKEFQAYQDFKE